jgi:LSD1 subclass zinc finger protein
MSDLVQENLRLQQQLQALQDSMAAGASSLVSPQQLHLQAEEERRLIQQQSQIQQQQEAYMAHQQAHRQRQQQQQQATSTAGDGSLKYVCCGNCRQWLSAPKDAVYVYCPGCQAVNNCAMVRITRSV